MLSHEAKSGLDKILEIDMKWNPINTLMVLQASKFKRNT